jgi:hypothetical protein
MRASTCSGSGECAGAICRGLEPVAQRLQVQRMLVRPVAQWPDRAAIPSTATGSGASRVASSTPIRRLVFRKHFADNEE